MKTSNLGRSGLRVSQLSLGTMGWGQEVDQQTAEDLLREFVDAGGMSVDTAYGYGDGISEELLGALRTPYARSQLVICAKAGISRETGSRVVDASRGNLLQQLDTSLSRLRTDYVDLWMVHAWDANCSLAETVSALETAVHSGRARYVGVSNYSGWQLAAAAYELKNARIPLTVNEIEYSLLDRSAERDAFEAAQFVGAGSLVWGPLAGGVLTGKYRRGVPADSRAAGGRHSTWEQRRLVEGAGPVVQALVTAADGLELSPTEIALAWLAGRREVDSAIVGVRTLNQLRTALKSCELELPSAIRDALEEVSS